MSAMPPSFGGFPPLNEDTVERSEQRFHLPNGDVRVLRRVKMNLLMPDGSRHKEESVDVPPLDDGIVPTDSKDFLFCLQCGHLVCRSVHSFECAACGQTFCVACRVMVQGEILQQSLCRACAKQAKKPWIVRVFERVAWGP